MKISLRRHHAHIVEDGALSQNIDHLSFILNSINLKGNFRNYNLTSEIPQISTRRRQTPDNAIGKLSTKFTTHEVLKSTANYKEWEKLIYQY